MKKISLAVSVLAASAVGASAADLPLKAKPIVAASLDWSGIYIGAHVGYGVKTDVLSLVVGLSMIDSVFDSDGLEDKYPEALTAPYVPGIAANIRLGLFGFSLVTAYYGALRQAHFTRNDQPVNIRPEAWSVEAGWGQAWIAATLALREKQTTLWDMTAASKIKRHAEKVRRDLAQNPGGPFKP